MGKDMGGVGEVWKDVWGVKCGECVGKCVGV